MPWNEGDRMVVPFADAESTESENAGTASKAQEVSAPEMVLKV